MVRPEKIRLGDLLIQQGLLSDEQLKFSLDEQKRSGRKLGRIVVESGFVTEEAISRALAGQLRIPFLDLKQHSPRPELLQLLSEAQARRFRAVVFDEAGGNLRVGFVDPTDLAAYDEIVRLTRRQIDPVVVAESQLLALIDRAYRRTEEISGLARELTADLGDVPVEFGELFATAPGAEDAPVVKLLQTVFEEAMRSRASDIHLEPQERALRVRFRIDGLLHVQMEADAKIAPALALRLKLISGLDISEKRLPQDGRFAIKVRNAMVDVRISTMPTQYGESVVMRLLNQNTGLLGLDRLGLPADMLERLRRSTPRFLNSTPPRRRSSPSRTRSNIDCRGSTRSRCTRRSIFPSTVCCVQPCAKTRTSFWWAKCATRRRPRSACARRSPGTWCCRRCTPTT